MLWFCSSIEAHMPDYVAVRRPVYIDSACQKFSIEVSFILL